MIAFLNVCCDKLCEMHYKRRAALAKSDLAILDGFCVLQSVSCIALTFVIVWQKIMFEKSMKLGSDPMQRRCIELLMRPIKPRHKFVSNPNFGKYREKLCRDSDSRWKPKVAAGEESE